MAEEKKKRRPGESVLEHVLKTHRIDDETIETVLEIYRENPDNFEASPMPLQTALIGLGISHPRAMSISQAYFMTIHGSSQPFGMMMSPSMTPQMPMMGMYPSYSNIEAEQRRREREEARQEMREAIQDMMYISTIQMLRGGGPMMGMGYNPYMEIRTEPIIGPDGKPVTDRWGNIIPKVTTVPIQPKGGGEGANSWLVTLLEREKERASKLEEKQSEFLQNILGEMRERLEALESRNSFEATLSMIDKLKSTGLVGGDGNIDVAKMKLDFEKWKHEQDMKFKQWLEEVREKREAQKMAKVQMEEFGKSIRSGITEVVKPVAQAWAEGYLHGSGGKAPRRSPKMKTRDLKEMSDEELRELLSKAEEGLKFSQDAKKKIEAELRRRSSSEAENRAD